MPARSPSYLAALRTLAWCWAGSLCAVAQEASESAPDPLQRFLLQQATSRLNHRDGVVRGEAALLVAASGQREHDAALQRIARDRDEAARVRGLLAIGHAGLPGAMASLQAVLQDAQQQRSPAGQAAAFALGAMAEAEAGAVVAQWLVSGARGSQQRQRELLQAMLVGLRQKPTQAPRAALLQLWEDGSLRDVELQLAVLDLLLHSDAALGTPKLLRLLERGDEAERLLLLRFLAWHESSQDAELLPALQQLAGRRDTSPALRALALQALVRRRHPAALQLVQQALQAPQSALFAAAVRGGQELGDAALRRDIEERLVAETDSERLAAMLTQWQAAPGQRGRERIRELAQNGQQPLAVRTAAALLLARSDANQAAPLVRELFLLSDHPTQLAALAAALPPADELRWLQRHHKDLATALAAQPAQWQALLRQGHAAVIAAMVWALGQPDLPAAQEIRLLQLWRQATTPWQPGLQQQLPIALRKLLQHL